MGVGIQKGGFVYQYRYFKFPWNQDNKNSKNCKNPKIRYSKKSKWMEIDFLMINLNIRTYFVLC